MPADMFGRDLEEDIGFDLSEVNELNEDPYLFLCDGIEPPEEDEDVVEEEDEWTDD